VKTRNLRPALLSFVSVLLALGPIPAPADGTSAPPDYVLHQLSTPAPAGVVARPDYVLHSGDQLAVTVFGEPSLSQSATLLPDGTITYPLVGQLYIGGDTIRVATAKLTNALQQYVKNPIVSIAVTQLGSYNVLVLGDVKSPGKYVLPSSAHLADAIAAAGGVDFVNGDYPDARVSIDNGQPVTASLQSLLRDGDVDANLALGSDTVVYVPGPTPMQVQVLGSVDKPGAVEVHVGDRLAMAVAAAGASGGSRADLSHIRLTRVAADGSTSVSEYNLYTALKDGDLTADPVLEKNDMIYVPQAHAPDSLTTFGQGLMLVLSRLIFW
jgi:polysaccharide biosynthesis/export protein